MRLEFVPLLELQRDLYRLPRNMARFQAYLKTMRDESGDDLALPPLVIINPMAREHVLALIDEYLQLRADNMAAQATAEAESALVHVEGTNRISLVVADDLKGGWTNRYATEFGLRCGTRSRSGERAASRSAWLTATLWSSEPPNLATVREEILTTAYRRAYRRQHGQARTIRQMLAQEGFCMAKAGCAGPTLAPEAMGHTRDVIGPYLDADDMPTAISCLFGDAAAESLGFARLGLSHRAGLALALYDARTGIT